MPASDRSDLISSTPEQRRAAGSFIVAIGAIAATISAADLAMNVALRSTASAPDGRFPTHYSVGGQMPFPVIMDHEHGWIFLAIFLAAIALLAAWSLLAARVLGGAGRYAQGLLVLGLVVVLALLTSFPVTFSLDSYAYAAFGRLLGVHGLNPYVERLASGSALGDPVLAKLTSFLGTPLPDENYGPAWTWLSAGLAFVSQPGGLPLLIWMQRVAGAAALVVAALGVLRLQQDAQPAERARRTALFALHPLVLYESATAGHNDMLMIAPAVWAFAVVEGSPLAAGFLIGASIAVKYVALIAVPFLAVRVHERHGAKGVLALVAPAVVLPVLLFAPLWPGWQAVGTLLNLGSTLIISPQWLVLTWFPALGARAVAIAFGGAFAAVMAFSFWRYVRSRCGDEVFRTAVALLWSSPLLNPWYVQWLLPAAAMTGRWARYAWWFGLFVTLRYFEDALRFPSTQAELSQRIALLEIVTLVMLLAPVALALTMRELPFQRVQRGDA
jgi:hypothetical protein